MAQSQADVARQRQINAGIVTLAAAQIAPLWPQIDWSSPAAATAVRTLYGAIVSRFGQASAAVAAQFYDDQRSTASVPGQYTAALADPLPERMLDKIVTSAFLGGPETVDHTHAGDPAQTTSDLPVEERVPARLDDSLQRLVLQPGRETIAHNTVKDPVRPRYVRVPQGATTCAFCVLLASRQINAKFSGYASAARAGGDAKKYHKHCDCEAVPIFPGQDVTEVSPNITDYQDMYHKAAADAGTRADAKKVLASMRKLHGLK